MLIASKTKTRNTTEDGDLFDVQGFRGSAVATGIKPDGQLDLGLIVADRPMAAGAVFTTSAAAAPPVELCRERLREDRRIRSIVINSGNANALTGRQGRKDAEAMLDTLERHCGGPGLVLSTGVIGEPLNMPPILEGIQRASTALSLDAGDDVARAMLTTDTRTKHAAVRIDRPGAKEYRVGGMAKGSGMIHPNMATMLAVMATDASIAPEVLDAVLRGAVDRSFHEISVDGETSTNDAVVLLARHPTSNEPSLEGDALQKVADAVTEVARDLAMQIVRDGEGMSRLMHLTVEGAAGEDEARSVARGVACSSLVKTALAGGDPNWGRIVAAACACGVPLSVERIALTRSSPDRKAITPCSSEG